MPGTNRVLETENAALVISPADFPPAGSLEFYIYVYTTVLFFAGVLALFWVLITLARRVAVAADLRPWFIGAMDFGILLCLLVSWMALAGGVVGMLMPTPEEPPPDFIIWQTALALVLANGGFLLLFMGYRAFLPFQQRVPLSQTPVPLGRAAATAVLYMLALVPIIFSLSQLWQTLLTRLSERGIDLPAEPQTLVGYFADAHSPLAFVTLLLLAVVLAPLTEELIFRAGIYRFLKGRMRMSWAVVLSSTLFASAHVNLLSFPILLLLGCVLCLAYEQTGSLRVPVLLHSFFNLNSVILIALQAAIA